MLDTVKIKATLNHIAQERDLDEVSNDISRRTDEVLSNFMTHNGLDKIFLDAGNHPTISELIRERLRVEKEIGEKYKKFTWFGTPTTGVEFGVGDGYYRHFQLGSIFWTPTHGAHEVHGAIRDKYATLGWERSYLGYPETDELSTYVAGVEVRYSNFRGGSIDWSPTRGAYIDPSIDVRTELHQLGGWVCVKGHGFTPNNVVTIFVEGLVRFAGTYILGSAYTEGDGKFSRTFDERMRPGQFEPVTIKVVDAVTGLSATGTTGAFSQRF